MADPVITPATPPAAAPVKPEPPAYVPPANEGTAISQNVAGSIIMPTVVFKHPKVAGEEIVDRGDKAEFIVVHRRFGQFPGGSRISAEDIVNPDEIPALIKFGAIQAIEKTAETARTVEPPKKPAAGGK